MVDGIVQVCDDLDGQHQVQIFGVPISLDGLLHRRHDFACFFVASKLHAGVDKPLRHFGQEFARDGLVHQQRLSRVANGGALTLGVNDDAPGHGQVGLAVDVHVAVARVMLDDGDGGRFHDGADKLFSAAGDQ